MKVKTKSRVLFLDIHRVSTRFKIIVFIQCAFKTALCASYCPPMTTRIWSSRLTAVLHGIITQRRFLKDFSTSFALYVYFLFHKTIKIDKPPVEIFFLIKWKFNLSWCRLSRLAQLFLILSASDSRVLARDTPFG